MDIVTLAAARKGGGSGGDVTKQYVDDHLALKADKAETAEYPIASTTTGVNPTITDSANGYVQSITIYGRTDTVEGELHGIGEDGELDVQTCGKNLFDGIVEPGTINTSTGENIYQANRYRSKNYIKVKPSTKYVFSYNGTIQKANWVGYTANKTYISNSVIVENDIIQTGENIEYVRFFYDDSVNKQAGLQLELGSTATAYEPYVSTTATVTTGIPLYAVGDVKDELDEKKGVVIKRCEKVTYDGGEDEEWAVDSSSYPGSNGSKLLYAPLPKDYKDVQPVFDIIPHMITSNALTIVSPINMAHYETDYKNGISIAANGKYFCIRIDAISTVADLKTYLASNPITVVYELAEPYELPLTSAELSALRGLRTYKPTTNVTVTDNPTVDVGYLLNTDNGQAVADVQQGLQAQIIAIPAFFAAIPEMHRNIFRGQNLGSSVTAAQLAAIADGSFDDLYVGDYWEIPVTIDGTTVSNKWRIADFDYFLHNGTDKRHAVIVPDNTLYTAQMGGTVSNGYYQSAMFTTNLNKGRTAIANAFPDMVIGYEYYDIIGQTTTKYDCTAELMALSSLTGVYSDYIHTNYLPVLPQMSLFRMMPDFIGANPNGSGHDAGFLTQTVKTSSFYWAINTTMNMMEMRTSDSYGVRPFFLLGDAGT